MPVINFHCHPPDFDWEAGFGPEEFRRLLESDEIDLWCMSPLDLRGLRRDPEYPYMTGAFRSDNATAARLREEFPGKIIPFVYVDPREAGAAATVRRWVEREGFRGLKLYPPLGFYPDSPEMLDFFGEIADLAIPILLHAGRVAPHPQLGFKYADPRYLEGAAFAARPCSIVAGHAGNPWKEVTFSLALGVRNVYVDLTTSGGRDPAFVKRVIHAPEIGSARMMWGSDSAAVGLKDLAAMRGRLQSIDASPADVENILGGTAARLLGVAAGG